MFTDESLCKCLKITVFISVHNFVSFISVNSFAVLISVHKSIHHSRNVLYSTEMFSATKETVISFIVFPELFVTWDLSRWNFGVMSRQLWIGLKDQKLLIRCWTLQTTVAGEGSQSPMLNWSSQTKGTAKNKAAVAGTYDNFRRFVAQSEHVEKFVIVWMIV